MRAWEIFRNTERVGETTRRGEEEAGKGDHGAGTTPRRVYPDGTLPFACVPHRPAQTKQNTAKINPSLRSRLQGV